MWAQAGCKSSQLGPRDISRCSVKEEVPHPAQAQPRQQYPPPPPPPEQTQFGMWYPTLYRPRQKGKQAP